jgi:hypothetical protein
MNKRAQDRLLTAVRAANKSAPVKFGKPFSVEVGQVRRLRAYDDDLDTMLVLLLHVDDDVGTAKVIGVSSPSDEATVRDLVVQRGTAGLPFDVILRVDGLATAWTTQLSGTPVVGTLPDQIVDLARRAPRMTSQELATEAEAVAVSTGSLRPQIGDPLWWEIGRRAEHLARLSDACHEAMLKPPIADPAILPSLLQGNDADQGAFFALCDALDKGAVLLSRESLESWGEALPPSNMRNQDLLRLFERRFLQVALRFSTADTPMASGESAEPTVRPARDLPSSVSDDPLPRLVATCAHSGEQSTHIWTSAHIWRERQSVFHTTVGGHRHAILADIDKSTEERG